MDPVDVAILALRLLLVGLLYAFLVVVLRLATRGLRPIELRPVAQTRAPARSNQLQLSVIDPGGAGLTTGDVVTISDGGILGRAQSAQVRLLDAAVSAEHARVSRSGRGWVVIDLGSTNGTRVNEAPVSGETALVAGDILRLGNVRLQVVTR